MVYVFIISALLVAIVIMLFFKNVTIFVSLLTAISAFILGLYQLSKDKRQVEFTILFADAPPPTGLGNIMLVNIGYLPVYFSAYGGEIYVYATDKKISTFKKFLNQLYGKWFSPFNTGNILTETFIIQDSKIDKNHNSSIVISSGNNLQHNFNSWDYKNFFMEGNSFFITDGIGNIFYLKQESVDTIKKVLKKYEIKQSKAEKNEGNAKRGI